MDWDLPEFFSEEQSEYTEEQSEYAEYEEGNDGETFDYEFNDVDDDENVPFSGPIQDNLDYDDFDIASPSIAWDDDSDYCHTDNASTNSNSHGIVYVRLLRARNLSCPVGSNVGATVSLPPYKGRVKNSLSKAFLGKSIDHGVCVKWGRERRRRNDDNDNCNSNHGNTDSFFEDEEGLEDEDGLLSMVNAWNGPKSPVPSIKIDLTFSPLGLGVFDFTMASIELSSTLLLKRPGVWRTRWCPMNISSSSSQSNGDHRHNYNPFIRIQALFVPSISSESPSKPIKDPVSPTLPPQSPAGSTFIIQKEDRFLNSTDPDITQLASNPKNSATVITEATSNDNREGITTNRRNDELVVRSPKNDFWDLQELSFNEETATLNEDSITVSSKRTTASQKAASAASALRSPHLLRAQTYWAPATCAVCSKLLIGIFRNGSGFRCEVCNIDCCSDCRLHVDVKVPCGSDLASDIVEASFRKKMSPSGLLSYIAPDEIYEEKIQSMLEGDASKQPSGNRDSTISIHSSKYSSKQTHAMTAYTSSGSIDSTQSNILEGIGRCRFEIITARLFEQHISIQNESSQENEKPILRKGDYYARVSMSDSDRSARTPTLQKTGGEPFFRSAEMKFCVSHYGVEFRIDVVDADTDIIIGSTFVTTHGLLQEQRDAYIAKNGASLLQFLNGPISSMTPRKIRLKLRPGIKPGASANEYYSFPLKSSGNSSTLGDEKNLISGWIELSVGIEELYSRMYGPNPIECPYRPPADLNMANFSNYISRIKAIADDLKYAIACYQYMVGWENPLWTALSLYMFIWVCLRFDIEYVGCLPIFFAIAFLVYCAHQRSQGRTKNRFIRRAVERIQKVEGNTVDCKIHRPKGIIVISVGKGRNLLNQELGIAGNTSCRVIWDPLRFVDEKTKILLAGNGIDVDTPFEMGNTPTIYTSDPNWGGIEESSIAKRLNQLLPSAKNDFFETSTSDEVDTNALVFPILQPIRYTNGKRDEGKLDAWESSKGAIVLQVRFQDFFNNLPGFDHVLGEVVIPFNELAVEKEIEGWYQVLPVGTNSNVFLEDHEVDGGDLFCGTNIDPPRIYVNLKWNPPTISAVNNPDDGERELSNVIEEEFVRSSILYKESKINLVDSSIDAVSKALGIGGTVQVVQNTLGSIVDSVEGFINLINFTDPYKSSIIFVGLLPCWVIFCLIPTRYIILLAGLAQYIITFVDKYGENLGLISERKSKAYQGSPDRADTGNPFATKIYNAIRSIPTNEDLRKTYFWESRQLGTETAKKYALEKRESRLKKLWKATWHSSSTRILVRGNGADHKKLIFAVVQGHRFLWWNSVDEFDEGELPSGKVILSGHAGLGGPSPIEMKQLDKEKELHLCLTIFGRGNVGQERVTLLLPDEGVKQDLENAIIHSSSFKKD